MTVRKRQFGTEKDSFALPVRHTRENDRKLSINRIFIVITLIFGYVMFRQRFIIR